MWGMEHTRRTLNYAYFCGEDLQYSRLRPKARRRACDVLSSFTKNNSSKTKGSKKKANTDAIPKRKPSTAPKKQKSGTGKQKTSELENISEADLTEAEQLKIVIKRSRQETHSSHASGSGADEGTGVTPGVPDAPCNDSMIDITWKEEEDDDEHDDDENDQEDDDASDDDKKAEDDDDEEMTESDNDDEMIVTMTFEERRYKLRSRLKCYNAKDQEMMTVKDANTDLDEEIKLLTERYKTISQKSRQTTQYADALSSIPALKSTKFFDSIDDGMKKIIKKEVRKEVSKIIPKVEKLVTDQLESEVLKPTKSVRYIGETVKLKDQEWGNDDEEPSAGTDSGVQERRSGKEPGFRPVLNLADQEFETGVAKRTSRKKGGGSTLRTGSKENAYENNLLLIIAWNSLFPCRFMNLFQPWLKQSGTTTRGSSALRESRIGKEAMTVLCILNLKGNSSDVYQRRIIAVTKKILQRVESYQKKLNLTKPDTYRSNLRRHDAYTPYSDPRGFIYENKDKKNRLMRIDELHKFSDGTLDDVRSALNDRLKGIRMEYLPETFWNHRDKANARAMIQAIDKRLKTRRIMRSLERFVGGRPYGGDLRLLQRTI
ncbi:hypothetical protein Tco_0442529 [Tanacetum coccineum]